MATRAIETGEQRLAAAARSTADVLCLAAAPAFAVMALLSCLPGGNPNEMVCSAMQRAAPLNGMAWMYLLMSAFHTAPWLRLVCRR
jgi:hypothetical protein